MRDNDATTTATTTTARCARARPQVIGAVNSAVTRAIAADEPRMGVLDTWAMTAHTKCGKYEDWIHHPVLAYEQIARWLSDRCPACDDGGPGGAWPRASEDEQPPRPVTKKMVRRHSARKKQKVGMG